MFYQTKTKIASPTTLRTSLTLLAACIVGAGLLAPGAAAQTAAPLFANDDPLELTLTLPLRTLIRQRSRRPDIDGSISYSEPGGAITELDVEVTTRGKSRLEMCSFPPLRLTERIFASSAP